MAITVRICPAPKCDTELVEQKVSKGWVMFCPKCGGSKIYWQRKVEGEDKSPPVQS